MTVVLHLYSGHYWPTYNYIISFASQSFCLHFYFIFVISENFTS